MKKVTRLACELEKRGSGSRAGTGGRGSIGRWKSGPWLLKARVEAMALAQINRPIGKRYPVKMSELLKTYGVMTSRRRRGRTC